MKTTRKLTMAFLMVMVALLAFVGSTFAWMTISNSITTSEPVTGQVQSAAGIYARIKKTDGDPNPWATSIDLRGLHVKDVKTGTASSTAKLVPLAMKPSVDYDKDGSEATYTVGSFSKLDNQNIAKAANNTNGINHFANANGGWIEFELEFYSDADVNLYVSNCVISSTNQEAKKEAAESCARVVLVNGTKTVALRSENSKGINYSATSEYGNYNYYSTKNPSYASFADAGIMDSTGIKEYPFLNYKTKHDELFKSANTVNSTDSVIANLTAGENNKATVKVYIYIEGWDALCANYLAESNISVKLNFAPVAVNN